MTSDPAADITTLLGLAAQGDDAATDRLYARLYDELRVLARSQLRREGAASIAPTGLVHEAWLRLAGQRVAMVNRGHFFGIAAQAMRRVLVDQARARQTSKRAGNAVTFDDALAGDANRIDTLLAVDDALERLALIAPRQARVVELRWFADLEIEEVAAALDISPATVKREWTAARAWLHTALGDDRP